MLPSAAGSTVPRAVLISIFWLSYPIKARASTITKDTLPFSAQPVRMPASGAYGADERQDPNSSVLPHCLFPTFLATKPSLAILELSLII